MEDETTAERVARNAAIFRQANEEIVAAAEGRTGMNDREERIGRNEALFRQVNERLEELNETFATVTDRFELVCECGDAGCVASIRMSPQEYDELRSDPSLFAVAPGHEIVDVETVVDRREGYYVVRKHAGAPRDLAEQTDPRS